MFRIIRYIVHYLCWLSLVLLIPFLDSMSYGVVLLISFLPCVFFGIIHVIDMRMEARDRLLGKNYATVRYLKY